MFEEAERSALLTLPVERFPFFHEAKRTVHRDEHVEVAKAYYSAPPEYLGRELWARWDGHTVRLFNRRMEQVAFHVQQEPGRFSTQNQHIASEKISGVERGIAWPLRRAALLGPHSQRWAEAMLHDRGVEGARVLDGLLSLANRHENQQIEAACELAQSHGAYRLRVIQSGFTVFYRSIFDVVRDFLHDEALAGQDKVLARYLKPDLLIIDDMGMKVKATKAGARRQPPPSSTGSSTRPRSLPSPARATACETRATKATPTTATKARPANAMSRRRDGRPPPDLIGVHRVMYRNDRNTGWV